MATNKDVDASAAPTQTPPVEPVETSNPARPALALAGVIGGGVAAAALLFGGGVLVGTALPDGGRHGLAFAHAQVDGQLPAGRPPLGGFPGGQQRPQHGQPPQHGDHDN